MDQSPQGHVILSHITLKFHYFSKIMKFLRYDATKRINIVAAMRRCVSQFLSILFDRSICKLRRVYLMPNQDLPRRNPACGVAVAIVS
jgi:hypothetical protein